MSIGSSTVLKDSQENVLWLQCHNSGRHITIHPYRILYLGKLEGIICIYSAVVHECNFLDLIDTEVCVFHST